MSLFINWASAIWRRMPKWVRRWGVLLNEARFTATAGVVVTDDAGRALLLQHRYRPKGGWGIPGGFIQSGEQPEEAIRRELREEIGLEVEHLELAFVRALERYNQIEIIFRCSPKTTFQIQGHEISRADWFAPDALPHLSDDQRRLIERAVTR